MTPEREQQLRSYLMGWNPTSGTAATYNKRHIKEKAGEAVLGLQGRYLKKGDKAWLKCGAQVVASEEMFSREGYQFRLDDDAGTQ